MKRQRILAVFKMEIRKLVRTPMYLFFSIFFVAMLVVILGISLGNLYGWGPDTYGNPRTIFEHMVPGLFAYAGIMMIFTFSSTLTQNRDMGIQTRMMTTPISSGEVIIGQMLAYSMVPLIQTPILIITALLMGAGLILTVGGVIMVFVFMIFLSFCSIGLGLITGTIAKDAKTAGTLAFIFIVPQQLFGSFIYMGEAAKTIGYVMPSQYATEGIYRIFYGGSLVDSMLWFQFGVLVLISIIIYIIGLKLFENTKKI